jgi:hypothetical protein
MNDNSETVGCIGKVFLASAVILIGALVGGFVVSTLWAWFVVPTFGIQPISIAQAIGLALVISAFKETKQDDADKYKTFFEKVAYIAIASIMSAVILLAMGWVVKLFI